MSAQVGLSYTASLTGERYDITWAAAGTARPTSSSSSGFQRRCRAPPAPAWRMAVQLVGAAARRSTTAPPPVPVAVEVLPPEGVSPTFLGWWCGLRKRRHPGRRGWRRRRWRRWGCRRDLGSPVVAPTTAPPRVGVAVSTTPVPAEAAAEETASVPVLGEGKARMVETGAPPAPTTPAKVTGRIGQQLPAVPAAARTSPARAPRAVAVVEAGAGQRAFAVCDRRRRWRCQRRLWLQAGGAAGEKPTLSGIRAPTLRPHRSPRRARRRWRIVTPAGLARRRKRTGGTSATGFVGCPGGLNLTFNVSLSTPTLTASGPPALQM